MATIEKSGLLKYKDKAGNLYIMRPVTNTDNVDGLDTLLAEKETSGAAADALTSAKKYTDQKIAAIPTPDVSGQIKEGQKLDTPVVATSSDGVAYVATVPGVDALTAGYSFIMIPNTGSTSTNTTLNVNGLGAKALRVRVSGYSGTTSSPLTSNWLAQNKPIRVTYDGLWWIAEVVLPSAQQLYGNVKAEEVTYINTNSGLSAAQVQAAIDELAGGALKTRVLTTAEYNAVTDKDEKTLYILSDDASEENVAAHIQNKSNPHGVTAKQVGAIAEPSNGTTGQVLTKGTNGAKWADPAKTVSPSTTTPKAPGTATAGSEETYARGDHVHPKQSVSKSDVGLGNVANERQYSSANPPPYPVTSVNGKTGAVTVETSSGTTYNTTLTTSGWSASGSYQKQTVTVTGLKANYPVAPVVDAQLTGTDADGDTAVLTGFSAINLIQTAANQLIAYCIGDAPTVNIPLIINTWG